MNLTDVNYVRRLKSDIDYIFNKTDQGRELMEFLENSCGWYQSVWDAQNRDLTLINDGKRQVVATIKNIMKLPAEDIVNQVKAKEE